MACNLFINSPAYYTQNYGVIDEVYQLCSDISRNIDIRNYTSSLESIGIVPIFAPEELVRKGQWVGHKKIDLSARIAIISLNSSFEDFFAAGLNKKKEMVVRNILDSLFLIKKRMKNNFNYDEIEIAILKIAENHLS